jgi:ComF family protein
MQEKFKKYFTSILDILFPPLCSGCKKILKPNEKEFGLCKECFQELKINFHFFCPVCKKRLINLKISCHKNAKFILGAPFEFENKTVKNIIYSLKYEHNKKGAKILAFFILQYLLSIDEIQKLNKNSFLMLPVPLHKIKERKRGYNQALILAEQIKFWKEKLDLKNKIPAFKIKIKNNKSQTLQKNNKEREQNVKDVFQIKIPEKIKNKNVIIVDDVFTSGSTTKEIAKLLKRHKAKKIITLVAAKA